MIAGLLLVAGLALIAWGWHRSAGAAPTAAAFFDDPSGAIARARADRTLASAGQIGGSLALGLGIAALRGRRPHGSRLGRAGECATCGIAPPR